MPRAKPSKLKDQHTKQLMNDIQSFFSWIVGQDLMHEEEISQQLVRGKKKPQQTPDFSSYDFKQWANQLGDKVRSYANELVRKIQNTETYKQNVPPYLKKKIDQFIKKADKLSREIERVLLENPDLKKDISKALNELRAIISTALDSVKTFAQTLLAGQTNKFAHYRPSKGHFVPHLKNESSFKEQGGVHGELRRRIEPPKNTFNRKQRGS